jgi:hypothetical protein
MTMGMEIKGQEIPEDPCKPCDFGKSKRTVSQEPQSIPEGIFDEIHVDPSGAISPTGFNGHKYSTMITDGCTCARWIFTHKEKTKTSRVVREFIVYIKT